MTATEFEHKLVSIVIPCRNEERHIATCLLSLLNNGYPADQLELLVVDGISDDGTKSVVEGLQKEYPQIKWIENPKKKTPFALNLGIEDATGDFILIASAHSSFDADYISILMDKMTALNADVVGGMMRTQVKEANPISIAIQKVLSHPFGVGNSMFRVGVNTDIQVDTVPFGLYKTELLRSINGYNEKLIRNHDMEMSKRLLAKGAKIFLTPDAQCTYFARETKQKMAKNNFDNGKWNMLTVYITKDFSSLSIRHFIPLCFVLSLLVPTIAMFIHPFFGILGLLSFGAYLTVLLLQINRMDRTGTTFLHLITTFVVLHFSYGIGSLIGGLSLHKLFEK
jgi:glycosyltransferase involved in cell wall biosynthesis